MKKARTLGSGSVARSSSRRVMAFACSVAAGVVAHPAHAGGPAGSNCDYLTADFEMEQVTAEGDRPVWSPDGTDLAFVTASDGVGEASELDLGSGAIRCLTCSFDHFGIYRIHYLPNGDYILLGRSREIVETADRAISTELYWLPANLGQPPQPLFVGPIFEGIAVSRESMTIAWNLFPVASWNPIPQYPPNLLPLDASMQPTIQQIWTGTVRVEGDRAELVDRRMAHESLLHLEVQDFFPGDRRILTTRVGPLGFYQVVGVDLFSGETVDYSKDPLHFNEAEGISPDGRFDFIESDRDTHGAIEALEIYALELDGNGKNVRRITHSGPFPPLPGQERSNPHNPTVSPDGRQVAVAVLASGNTVAGAVEQGVFLITFDCD